MNRTIVVMLLCMWSVCVSSKLNAADELVIHEWGTFTSLQDEGGRAVSRINTDDEPVPGFVHQMFYSGRFSPVEFQLPAAKGAPHGHPEVTMRLETPVTYFHLPKGVREITTDIRVSFNGGWLTEFFPNAEASIDQNVVTTFKNQDLRDTTKGQLDWRGVQIGAVSAGPETDEAVWLAPRKVQAAQLRLGEESERFLFYRGVGHRNAPLRVVRSKVRNQFELYSQASDKDVPLAISKLWLVQVKKDGQVAFRLLPALPGNRQSGEVLTTTSSSFGDIDFSHENLESLQNAMKESLLNEGLFDDEAKALLDTWRISYFKSPGVRLFFLVPQSWTDHVLPLTVSVPAKITRVMIGRIEIVTPEQRGLIQRLVKIPPVNLKPVVEEMRRIQKSTSSEEREEYKVLASGRGQTLSANVAVPESYQVFLDLGRFRTPLILDHLQDRSHYQGYLNQFATELMMPGLAFQRYQLEQDRLAHIRTLRQIHFRRNLETIVQPLQAPAASKSIAFVGDQLIDDWDVNKMFPQQSVIRLGSRTFFPSVFQDYIERLVAPHQPRVVIIHTGLSEVSSGMLPSTIVSEMQEFIAKIREQLPDTKVLVIPPIPISTDQFDFQSLREVRRLVRQLPDDNRHVIVVDVDDDPLVDENGLLNEDVVDQKGRLNQSAYERLSRAITARFAAK